MKHTHYQERWAAARVLHRTLFLHQDLRFSRTSEGCVPVTIFGPIRVESNLI